MQHNTLEKTTKALIEESLPKSRSYTENRNLVAQMTDEKKPTGSDQTEALPTTPN